VLAALRLREGDAAMRVAIYNVDDCVGRDWGLWLRAHHCIVVLTEVGADVVVLQGFTLNRVGDLVGRLEKTRIWTRTIVFSNVASDVATTCS
jgi:hypothetical protein